MGSNPNEIIVTILAILLALSIHEYAHAKMADLAGDPTPAFYGRVTLNPLAHLDPIGTVMIVLTTLTGFGIGWGKPVPVNPKAMRNPRWDHFASVAAGPLSNLVQAVIWAVILRAGGFLQAYDISSIYEGRAGLGALFLLVAVQVNIAIFLFNLIPLGPLDGHWMLGTFMPEEMRLRWYLWNRQVGSIVLLAIILGGQFIGFSLVGMVLQPLMIGLIKFLLGLR
ncbi:MAG: site-2 protease family protein [Fimbriimonas sp.]